MDKKTIILETALRLFVENGFHGTATGMIAKEAGVANGTLFNYFHTKDELIVKIYLAIKQELADHVHTTTQNDEGIRDFMRSQYLTSLLWALDNPAKFKFIQQFHASPFIAMPEIGSTPEQLEQTSFHSKVIHKAIQQKILRNIPVDFVMVLVSSHTFGVFQYIQSKKLTKVERHKLIETSFELLWQMLQS